MAVSYRGDTADRETCNPLHRLRIRYLHSPIPNPLSQLLGVDSIPSTCDNQDRFLVICDEHEGFGDLSDLASDRRRSQLRGSGRFIESYYLSLNSAGFYELLNTQDIVVQRHSLSFSS